MVIIQLLRVSSWYALDSCGIKVTTIVFATTTRMKTRDDCSRRKSSTLSIKSVILLAHSITLYMFSGEEEEHVVLSQRL